MELAIVVELIEATSSGWLLLFENAIMCNHNADSPQRTTDQLLHMGLLLNLSNGWRKRSGLGHPAATSAGINTSPVFPSHGIVLAV